MNTNVQVAEIIRAQLGGNRFAVMTGAKNWIALSNGRGGVSFKIGKNARGVTHVRIVLGDDDLYSLEFLKCRGVEIKTISDFYQVHVDGLRGIFTEETGMYTNI